jgi:hypothetical protein
MLALRYIALVVTFLVLCGLQITSASPSPQANPPAREYWVCSAMGPGTPANRFFHSSVFRSSATQEEIQAAFIKYMSGIYGDYVGSNSRCVGSYNYDGAEGNLSKYLSLAKSMAITDIGWGYGVSPAAATNEIYVYCAAYEANGPLVFTSVFVVPRTSGYPQNWSERPAVVQAFKNSVRNSGTDISGGGGSVCSPFDDRQSAEAELQFEENGDHSGRGWKEISWRYHR